jgi:signal peptidase I
MRYQHIVPAEANWLDELWPPAVQPRPRLITDFYAFNTRVLRKDAGPAPGMLGLHWVGDLILDCELDVSSPSGTVMLDLVKGGRHFRSAIDLATGQAELTIDGVANWRRTAATSVRGIGKYRVMFANVDQQLLLWVNDKVVAFDAPATYDSLGNDRPQAAGSDGGDLAPAGIGSRGAALAVNHLRVLRDVYYIADTTPTMLISDFRYVDSPLLRMSADELADFYATPEMWESPQDGSVFDRRQDVEFVLGPDQFFVLGDNSPASSDARLWSTQHFVPRSLLIGKALFVYWPHPLNLQIPMTDVSIGVIPNVPAMGLIR